MQQVRNTSECSELLGPMRANCRISAQHSPGKFDVLGTRKCAGGRPSGVPGVAGNCPGHAWAAFLKRRAGHGSWPRAPRARARTHTHTHIHTRTWRWDSERAWRAWGASAIQFCHIVAAHHGPLPQKPAPCSLRSAGRNVRLIITSRSGARASQRSVVLSPLSAPTKPFTCSPATFAPPSMHAWRRDTNGHAGN